VGAAAVSAATFPPEELRKNRCGARLVRGGGAGPRPAKPPGATEARPGPDFLSTDVGCGICDDIAWFCTSPRV
jgi:hypothetical protein